MSLTGNIAARVAARRVVVVAAPLALASELRRKLDHALPLLRRRPGGDRKTAA